MAHSTKSDYQVLIVGAGPVGLWTAIQLKLRSPHVQILMLDKHRKYKRSHTITLDARICNDIVHNVSFQEFASRCTRSDIFVRTFAHKLRVYAQHLDIDIMQYTVTSYAVLHDILMQFPSLTRVIAADGAQSLLRKCIALTHLMNSAAEHFAITQSTSVAHLFGPTFESHPDVHDVSLSSESDSDDSATSYEHIHTLMDGVPRTNNVYWNASAAHLNTIDLNAVPSNLEYREFTTLKHVVQVRYYAECPQWRCADTSLVMSFMSKYLTLKLIDGLAEETVTRSSTHSDYYLVTVRFYVAADVYETVSTATFMAPLSLDNAQAQRTLHPTLRRIISTWLNARAYYLDEHRASPSPILIAFNLTNYAATAFTGTLQVNALLSDSTGETSHTSAVNSFGDKHNERANSGVDRAVKLYLVGDAAFAVPFLHSLTNGLMAANRLAKVVATQVDVEHSTHLRMDIASKDRVLSAIGHCKHIGLDDDSYEYFMHCLSTTELYKAQLHYCSSTQFNFATQYTAQAPSQIIRLDDALATQLQNERALFPHVYACTHSKRSTRKVLASESICVK